MYRVIFLLSVLCLSCTDPPASGPIPKIYSWQDCDEDVKESAQKAFEGCLNNLGLAGHEYEPGDRFTPRNCETYAIALYCMPNPRVDELSCGKKISAAVDANDAANEAEKQQLKADADMYEMKYENCRGRENEIESCPGVEALVSKCLKAHADEQVEAP